jgi:hypothetical protein
MITEGANIKVNVIWLAIGIIFLSFAIVYLRLAIKSRQKVSLKNIEIDKLNEEEFRPKQAAGMEIIADGQNVIVRSKGLELIASQLNKITGKFEQHLNQNILPKIKEHINEIYRTSGRGFWIAGILAIVSTVLAFLSAFMVL